MLLSATPPAKMKHLRIKLVGELDDLFYRHVQRLRFEPITCFQIVKIALFHMRMAEAHCCVIGHSRAIHK